MKASRAPLEPSIIDCKEYHYIIGHLNFRNYENKDRFK